ncbi:ABC transporter permease [Plantactinospora mayteni]|uniref:Transport permease protein n=1 Tax=Plantactinospora mayteni TaxID=566021 RepID=A0ABQ4F358_9ACTN|nr:ABC transporter permease [Plantactinospora mayteni]GIH01348.1 transport permease protein [Plantactinospora mayteni]
MRLTLVELKLLLRDPGAAFFTLAFPLILLVMNGAGEARKPIPELGGQRTIDVAAPMLTTMVVAILGLTSLPVLLAHYREIGVLKRMATTPVSPQRVLVAQFAAHLLIAVASLALVLGVGVALFDMAPPKAPVSFAVGFALGATALFALGFVLAALAPTARSASAVGLGIFFPMLYLSGTMMPAEIMPDALRRIGYWTPLSPVVRTLRETWAGEPLDLVRAAVLVAVIVVAGGTAARIFRW